MHGSSTVIMLAVATGFLVTAASADETRQFKRLRGARGGAGPVWQEWALAVYVRWRSGVRGTYVLGLGGGNR